MSHQPNHPLLGSAKRRALFKALLQEKGLNAPSVTKINRRRETGQAPLSFAQQRLWFLHQLEPDSSSYNIPAFVRLRGRLDPAALERSLNEVIRRHEALRTTFPATGGEPQQLIAPSLILKLAVDDLSELSRTEREEAARRISLAESAYTFNLAEGPLMRARLLRLDEQEHILLLMLHHIISDDWSMSLLVQEAAALYKAFSTGVASTLPELPIQYADFAEWQRGWLQGGALEAQLSYWKNKLGGTLPPLDLPTRGPRPPVQSTRGASRSILLPSRPCRALKELSQAQDCTLFMTLLAAFDVLLSRYAGQTDILVGTPIANRRHVETERLIGFFVNTLVLRLDLSGDPGFLELMQRAREVTLEAYTHQDVPFERLVEELHPARDLSRQPLFQVMFAFQNTPLHPVELPGLTWTPLEALKTTSKFDLTLTMSEESDTMLAMMEYSVDLFEDSAIERLLRHFQLLLEAVVANPDRRVSELPLLSQAERQQMLFTWNETHAEFPQEKCLHELFEEQARRTPEALALIHEDVRLTYFELNRRANQLAHYLRGLGVGPEVLVGICAERSVEMSVGLLGILKAGGAYVPLDPAYPRERLAFMLEDGRIKALLTQRSVVARLPTGQFHILLLDTDWPGMVSESAKNPDSKLTPDNLAYVIYTSGSTGRPKAVMMPHRPLVNLLAFQDQKSSGGAALRTIQFTSLSFDVSFQEIFSTWYAGAALVLIDEESRRDARKLWRVLMERNVERLFLPYVTLQHLAEAHDAGRTALCLRQVITAGEQLKTTRAIRNLFAGLEGCSLENQYGPTESHVASAFLLERETSDWPELPPIGRPISNAQLYVLDEAMQPVPLGVTGELYIGGECLARGYLYHPAETAEKFVPHPFDEAGGSRLYSTGDLARYLSDGNIEFLGRRDHQLKVRGYRVETGEVEAALRQHPSVREALVSQRILSGAGQLVAYVLAEKEAGLTTSELRHHLQEKLPEYMIPSAYVFLNDVPLTPSGKIDRAALPAPDQMRPKLEEEYVSPDTLIEKTLARIWSHALGVERIGAHDNFFELGGHSLLATRVMSGIREAFGVELPLRALFESPSVAGLARHIELMNDLARRPRKLEEQPPDWSKALAYRTGAKSSAIIPCKRDRDYFPLSFAQQRLWFLHQLMPQSSAYNMPTALRLKGMLDVKALEQSLNVIIRRHEALRTSFRTVEGQPAQVIAPFRYMKLQQMDLSTLPSDQREESVLRLSNEAAQRPFNLSIGPIMRASLLRLAEDEHVLLFTMHHIISDGWSIGVLINELGTLYRAFATHSPSTLRELPIQYVDYAVWQREWLTGEVLERQLGYWKQQLQGAPPVLELPADRPRPPVQSFRGSYIPVVLSRNLTEKLVELSRGEGATLFMTLLAAFQILLYRYTGQEDIVVGSPIANRNRSELENLIGFFVNSLVLRTSMEGDPTFRELLGRVLEVAFGAYEHQDVPFERLIEELQPQRTARHNPLFQVVFALQNAPAESLELPGLTLSMLPADKGTEKFDLTLRLFESEGVLRGSFGYNSDIFDASTVERMLHCFNTLLQGIASNPDQRISVLPLLEEDEKRQLLTTVYDVQTRYRQSLCLHQLFEEQARRTPQATALIFQDEELTYDELNRRANQLAHYLRALGVGPDVLVGICTGRSIEMVIGLLGILKAGAAYLPLDPAYPPERLSFMLQDARISVLLVQESLIANLPQCEAKLVCLDSEWETIGRQSEVNPLPLASPDNLAYVIYTSGSTGQPKGVLITHANLARLFSATAQWFHFSPHDVWTLFHSYAFDFSVWELWGALAYGGRVVIVPYLTSRSPEAFYQLLSAEKVTVVNQTPSAFRQLMACEESLSERPKLTLRLVIFGGEALEVQGLWPWIARHGDERPRLVNMYGITETTVHVTYRPLTGADTSEMRGSVIGGPIPDLQVYILDQHMQPVPVGVPGEMYVGGDGVARGYLNRPGLTAVMFVPDPFSQQAGARLYKSGDLARRLTNGDIEYLGRLDQQVKIRGFRIELGEIEAALVQYPDIRDVAVVAKGDGPGNKSLIAYVAINQQASAPSVNALRSFLSDKLPEYMIPSSFVTLDKLPLTAHGKLDWKALPEPGQIRPDLEQSYIAPRNELESHLARMWREILGIDQIGINDDFFNLGGDSIKGAVFINKLQETLKEIIHVVIIFQAPTIAQLAAYLNENYSQAVKKIGGVEPTSEAQGSHQNERVDAAKVELIRRIIKPLPPRQRSGPKNRTRNPPAIFVLSPPRSGSTLLRVMLAGHPQLFAPPELELLSFNTLEERKAAFSGPDSFWLEGTVRALMEIKSCDAAQARGLMEAFEARQLTVQDFYRQMQRWLGERRLVDKTPSYALDQSRLRKAEAEFENALYIHLLRHPLGMIRSFEEAKLDQIFFRYEHPFSRRELAELIWLVSHQNILEFLSDVPGERQHRVKFEDLVSRPHETMKGVCRFLGLDLHPDMLQPYQEKQRRMTDGLHAASRMLGDVKFHEHKGIEAEAATRWKEYYSEDFLGEMTWELAREMDYRGEPVERKQGAYGIRQSGGIEHLQDMKRDLPLSFAQQRLWFLDQLIPGNSAYNLPAAVRLQGTLDAEALRASLSEVVKRHEVLRTSFQTHGGRAVQMINLWQPLVLPVNDLGNLQEAEREAEARRLATLEAQRPFDLSSGPMLRAKLLRLGECEHVLLLNMHHIAADGWSLGIIISEVAALYEAFSQGQPSPLKELPIQYSDYARWQCEWLRGEKLDQQIAYWKAQLAGAPAVLELPVDHPRPHVQTSSGAHQVFNLPAALREQCRELSRLEGVTLFMTLLAAFQTLLYRYTAQEDICVGTPVAGRNRPEIENLIGFFINTLVLRGDLSGNPRFNEFLGRIQKMSLGAFAHQDLPFEKLVEELQPERDVSHTPLFQVMFALQNAGLSEIKLGNLALSAVEVEQGTAKFDLTLSVEETEQGLKGVFEYNTDLFEATTIKRMVGHWQTMLEGIAAHPARRLSELPLLTEAERDQALVEWNDTEEAYPADSCLHHLFEAQARRAPDSVALTFEDEQLTYDELNRWANQLGHHLRSLGVGPEALVGLCIEPSFEMIASLLGILKAGAAFVPLNANYPRERLAFMLDDAQVSLLLTQEHLLKSLPPFRVRAICVDSEREIFANESASDLPEGAVADNLAYVIYTSGSTGRPKGTLLAHRGLCNLATQAYVFKVGAGSRLLQFASSSFDASVWEIVMALTTGGTLCLYHRTDSFFDGSNLIEVVSHHNVNTAIFTPSVLNAISSADFPTLRTVISGGENCPAETVARWSPGRLFFNAYGPTEITVCSSMTKCESDEQGAPPIGRPLHNVSAYILDREGNPVPVGVTGELHIGGVGLARGYLNQPGLTAKKFTPDGLSGKSGARLYKTGDLARFRTDGQIEYLGRIDHQVKVRGYRIELGEIEETLRLHPRVREALALAREDVPGDKRVVAYLILQSDAVPDKDDLRRFLSEKLPDHLIPSVFVMLSEWPLTPSGKIDRRALPKPEQPSNYRANNAGQPRALTEEMLASIWAEVLGVERVSIQDNFFELGGHSLLATQVISRLRERFGIEFPLRKLFEHPTIESLASALRTTIGVPRQSPLVAMQPRGSRPPFFCVHPAGGTVYCYADLSRLLGPDQPFYGFNAQGLNGERPPHTRVEDMASVYIKALRDVQPTGPYLLGGWSFGGVVAYEMAQQLLAQDEQIALLALIDSVSKIPDADVAGEDRVTHLLRFALNLGLSVEQLTAGQDQPLDSEPEEQLRWILKQAQAAHLIPSTTELVTLRNLLKLYETNVQAMLNYNPATFSGRITFFKAVERLREDVRDPSLGWSKLATGGLEVHEISGNHFTIMRRPHLNTLAAQLSDCLSAAAETS
jgi:amino acid adenylation domain-containing protein